MFVFLAGPALAWLPHSPPLPHFAPTLSCSPPPFLPVFIGQASWQLWIRGEAILSLSDGRLSSFPHLLVLVTLPLA